MGARVLIKKCGITYVGIDVFPGITQENLNIFNSFIHPVNEQIIIAKNDNSKVLNLLDIHKKWFDFSKNKEVTKEEVINNIVNPLFQEAKKRKMLDKENIVMDAGFFIITQQRNFQVLKNFSVIEIEDYASFSYEEMIMYAYVDEIESDEDPIKNITDIMKSMYKHLTYIHQHFYVFENKNMSFVFIGG